MFVKHEAKVASKVSGVKLELCILSSCFLSPMSKNSVLEELRGDWQSSRKRFNEGHFAGG